MNSLQYISTQVESLIGGAHSDKKHDEKTDLGIHTIEEEKEQEEGETLATAGTTTTTTTSTTSTTTTATTQTASPAAEANITTTTNATKENRFIASILYLPRAVANLLLWTLGVCFKPVELLKRALGMAESTSTTQQQQQAQELARSLQSPYGREVRLPRPKSAGNQHRILFPPRPLLRPSKQKKTLVLDLDETLIHSLSRSSKFSQGQMVEVKLDNSQLPTLYLVNKRPYCDEFLKAVSQWFRLVVFTASVQKYADPMIDWLEQERKYFSQRFYRQHCAISDTGFIKDLNVVDTDPSKVIIIDNSPISYYRNEQNAVGIEGWISDPSDHSLLNLIPFLNAMRYTSDVRSVLSLKVGEDAFDDST